MNVQFLLYLDEEDEPNHSLSFDLPSIPQTGDLVTISRPGQEGCTNFVVRRTQWDLDFPDDQTTHRAGENVVGTTTAVTVECTYAVGPFSSEEHKRSIPGNLAGSV